MASRSVSGYGSRFVKRKTEIRAPRAEWVHTSTISLNPPRIRLSTPLTKKSGALDRPRPLVKYFVDFQGKEAARLLALSIPSSRQVIQTSAPEQILRLFEDLIETGMRWSPFQKRICAVILEQLLLRVSETAVPFGSIGSEAFETYQRCRRYIETHYRTAAGLPDIAQDCNVDPAYLCRLFKRFDYQSPWQYVIQLKMRYAAQQLQMPQALIKRVAQELGFSDAFQFSHTFRRVYGISPRQFIQLQRTSSD